MATKKNKNKHRFGIFNLKHAREETNICRAINGYPWPYAPWTIKINPYLSHKPRVGQPRVGAYQLYSDLEYASLANWRKIELLTAYNDRGRHEPNAFNEYMTALTTNEINKISFIEEFGGSTHYIIRNYQDYLFGLVFGLNEISFNQHGWLETVTFEIETIPLFSKNETGTMAWNYIELGQSPNGKWAYGTNLSLSNCGIGSAPSVYDTPFESRKECLLAALSSAEAWFLGQENSTQSDATLVKKVMNTIKALRVGLAQPSKLQESVQGVHEAQMVQASLLGDIFSTGKPKPKAHAVLPIPLARPVQLTFF